MAKKKATSRKPTLNRLRKEIEKIDRNLVELLDSRAELAVKIGRAKQEKGLPIYAPQREEEVLTQSAEHSQGPLPSESVRGVIREVISACRAMECPLRIAYLGPEYTYSHLAAIHRFGKTVDAAPVATIAAVFEAVEREHVDFGLVPVENSTDGRVADTLDMFARSPARICGEVPLRIHHNLLGVCQRNEVRQVFSKPQALSQCRKWLAEHLPKAKVVETASTAEAAQLALDRKGAAAVASIEAGASYHLNVLAKNIEDDPQNLTRFAVIGREPADKTGDDKTSLMFEVDHKPGALADAMTIFKRKSLNLTWIESFPIPSFPGRYLFFVELLGHQRDIRVRRALEQLEAKAVRLEVLGSYARMAPIG